MSKTSTAKELTLWSFDDKCVWGEYVQKRIPNPVNLYAHQQRMVDSSPDKHLLAFSTGTGKTITAISLVNGKEDCDAVLVICPKTNVVQWAREIEKYIAEGMYVSVISKEEFKKQVKFLDRYDAVIVDEAHYFAGMTSQLAKSLFWYMEKHDIKYRYLATATPYLSSPLNIFTLAKHLGYKWNYINFKHKFFYEINMGGRVIPQLRPNMEGEVAKLVQLIGTTVDMKEVAVVPEQTHDMELVELTDEQSAAIEEVFDPQFIVRWTKKHQIENGFQYMGKFNKDGLLETYKNNKVARLVELARTEPKIIIVCRYKAQIQYYADKIGRMLDEKPIYILDGNSKDKQSVIDRANAEKTCVLLVQASCSAGYELPTFRTMVFASMSFSYVDYKQMIGRNLRINHLEENKYLHLVAEGVDMDVYRCIMRKEDFSMAIYGDQYKSEKLPSEYNEQL
jgi:superfamily II DNA or RNA helicase